MQCKNGFLGAEGVGRAYMREEDEIGWVNGSRAPVKFY